MADIAAPKPKPSADEIPHGLYARFVIPEAGERGRVYVFESGVEIDNFNVPAVHASNLLEIAIGATMFGWTFLGQPDEVKTNQYFVRVERRVSDED